MTIVPAQGGHLPLLPIWETVELADDPYNPEQSSALGS